MAAVNVTIIYNGSAAIVDREGESIFRYFAPNNSYVDTPVFTEGYPVDAKEEDKEYGRSIYATNYDGRGILPGLLPMAHTTTRFAQFERAVIAAADAVAKEEENKGISFDIGDDYKEELYWVQMAKNMVELGFYIKVGDVEYGEKPGN